MAQALHTFLSTAGNPIGATAVETSGETVDRVQVAPVGC